MHLLAGNRNILAGLYYPMIVASMTDVVGSLLLQRAHGRKVGTKSVTATPQLPPIDSHACAVASFLAAEPILCLN